jgi:hypothetical protein
MNFSNALNGIMAGQRVARASWEGVYLELVDSDPPLINMVTESGDTETVWSPTLTDLLAEDWELV